MIDVDQTRATRHEDGFFALRSIMGRCRPL